MKNAHGTPEVWEEIFSGADTTYSESPVTQNQLFEYVKLSKLDSIFPKEKFKMLEVGCGSAQVSLYFAKRNAEVVCLDVNKSVLEFARGNFAKERARAKFVVGNAEKLKFPDDTFDVVASFGLMEHFENPAIAINEMVRVLRPGGTFFADIVPNRFSCQYAGNIFNFCASCVYGLIKGKPYAGFKKGMRNFRPLYYENSIGWKEYEKIIKGAGIKKTTVRGNRPFPRLTLPDSLDRIYTRFMKLFLGPWHRFDESSGNLSKIWGAGWWFWGVKGIK